MDVRFTRNTVGQRWAYTQGLAGRGQAEIAVPLRWPEGDPDSQTVIPRDRAVVKILDYIHAYIAEQPKRITAGQTMTYGWGILRFRPREASDAGSPVDALIVQERTNPFSDEVPTFEDGVVRVLALEDAQNQALRRNKITGTSEHPHRWQMALVCTRVRSQGGTSLFMERTEAKEAWDSGWCVGCVGQQHNHDNPDDLHTVHLTHLVANYPRMFPYLAMPVGTSVVLDPDKTIMFRPGEDTGYEDEAPPFTTRGLERTEWH
jgi:hypothetical protein